MNILILNGSPRRNGNPKQMVEAFKKGAESSQHKVQIIDVCKKNIHGCLGCDYCQKMNEGVCIQKDDMQEILSLLREANMLVLASPVYYHSFSGQLKCVIDRTYAVLHPGKMPHLKQVGMILSSGSDDVYEGAMYELERNFHEFMHLDISYIKMVHGNINEDILYDIEMTASSLKGSN